MAEEKKEKEKKKPVIKFAVPVLAVLLVGLAFGAGVMWSKMKSGGQEGEGAGEQEEDKRALQFEVKDEEVAETSPEAGGSAVLGEEKVARIGEGGVSKGEENAPVTLVEFSEYLCPYCAEYVGVDAIPQSPIEEDKTYRRIMEEYVDTGKVRYVFKQYPIHGEAAQKAAEASLCAHDQGKFWEYHDLLFENFGFKTEDLPKLANQLGLDGNAFSQCLESGKFKNQVIAEYEEGNGLGGEIMGQPGLGTPTFFINGKPLRGAQPFDNFKALIEAELGG